MPAIYGSDNILLLRYLILLPSRERAKQVFLLIFTLNILVIKQHRCKPIGKSILIGTKISRGVELQLNRMAFRGLLITCEVWSIRHNIREKGKVGSSPLEPLPDNQGKRVSQQFDSTLMCINCTSVLHVAMKAAILVTYPRLREPFYGE